ncbi:cupin domain-containing protein [Xanthobacter sp. KR7-65]|uniref:cupin domain-containing protein n=1 Tax=Xanthobacter sp. KR7-65 TaxID=3156612 RepID=UPI0032B5A62D
MLNRRGFVSCAICTAVGFAATEAMGQAAPAAAPQGVSRKVLSKTDLTGTNYVTVLMEVEFDAGFKVARHTHPGIESGFLMSGGGVLSVKGQPDRTLGANEGFQIPVEVPHAFQVGGEKTRLAITYVVDKDKPLASPAPE